MLKSNILEFPDFLLSGVEIFFPFWDHRSDIKKFLQTEIAYTKKNNNIESISFSRYLAKCN